MHATVHLWRSKDNSVVSVSPSTFPRVPRIKFRFFSVLHRKGLHTLNHLVVLLCLPQSLPELVFIQHPTPHCLVELIIQK